MISTPAPDWWARRGRDGMAYSAKNVKESLGQGEDMERDDERVETHISGVRNLSEEAREMRAAGRKLVGKC